MTIPAAAGKTNVDQGASDTPAAGRQDIEGLIDKFNTLRSHLLTSAITSGTSVLGVGTGLQSSNGNLVVNFGSGIGQAVQLENVGGSAGLPAVDGSLLTGVVGTLVQVVTQQTGAVETGAVQMPIDNTVPQNTEGTEFMTLSITPTNVSNNLIVQFTGLFSVSSPVPLGVALFKDSGADAIAATLDIPQNSTVISLSHVILTGSTSSQTFKIRAGTAGGQTVRINASGASAVFGGLPKSSMIIWEVSA